MTPTLSQSQVKSLLSIPEFMEVPSEIAECFQTSPNSCKGKIVSCGELARAAGFSEADVSAFVGMLDRMFTLWKPVRYKRGRPRGLGDEGNNRWLNAENSPYKELQNREKNFKYKEHKGFVSLNTAANVLGMRSGGQFARVLSQGFGPAFTEFDGRRLISIETLEIWVATQIANPKMLPRQLYFMVLGSNPAHVQTPETKQLKELANE